MQCSTSQGNIRQKNKKRQTTSKDYTLTLFDCKIPPCSNIFSPSTRESIGKSAPPGSQQPPGPVRRAKPAAAFRERELSTSGGQGRTAPAQVPRGTERCPGPHRARAAPAGPQQRGGGARASPAAGAMRPPRGRHGRAPGSAKTPGSAHLAPQRPRSPPAAPPAPAHRPGAHLRGPAARARRHRRGGRGRWRRARPSTALCLMPLSLHLPPTRTAARPEAPGALPAPLLKWKAKGAGRSRPAAGAGGREGQMAAAGALGGAALFAAGWTRPPGGQGRAPRWGNGGREPGGAAAAARQGRNPPRHLQPHRPAVLLPIGAPALVPDFSVQEAFGTVKAARVGSSGTLGLGHILRPAEFQQAAAHSEPQAPEHKNRPFSLWNKTQQPRTLMLFCRRRYRSKWARPSSQGFPSPHLPLDMPEAPSAHSTRAGQERHCLSVTRFLLLRWGLKAC